MQHQSKPSDAETRDQTEQALGWIYSYQQLKQGKPSPYIKETLGFLLSHSSTSLYLECLNVLCFIYECGILQGFVVYNATRIIEIGFLY